ncbi:hypothetical protein SUGI_0919410 [Cryptomeria japonica]|uniref:transcription factor MYB8 n=1 Tax=Cryptomeria japonica TaxID=3369 RepID=UPI002414B4EA|nr:transcription factor MYB8 [Cryptomeria japonica]GLJ44085.1 hypothetical protein SUGI_0919410 [Cryptomeria japonica]
MASGSKLQERHKGPWTPHEDHLLKNYIVHHGEGRWCAIPQRTGLLRCPKSCRLRWINYLRPDVKRGHISEDEEELIIRLHKLLGNRWSLIAKRVPGRTDNEVKNYWNTRLSKKLHGKGIDPNTHKPLRAIQFNDSSEMKGMMKLTQTENSPEQKEKLSQDFTCSNNPETNAASQQRDLVLVDCGEHVWQGISDENVRDICGYALHSPGHGCMESLENSVEMTNSFCECEDGTMFVYDLWALSLFNN